MGDFTKFICFNLKTTNKKVEKYMTVFFEGLGINVAQSFILSCLFDKDGLTFTEIGTRAQIENSSLTTMADKLEKLGLVQRKLDPQNRRVIRLFLTDPGRQLAVKIQKAGIMFDQYLRSVLGEDVEKLLHCLTDVSNSVSHNPPEPDSFYNSI